MLSRRGNAFALADIHHFSQPKAKHPIVLDADDGKTTLGRGFLYSFASSTCPLRTFDNISLLNMIGSVTILEDGALDLRQSERLKEKQNRVEGED